jgi:cysteine desulfurase
MPGRRTETLVIQLDLAGIAVSAGAACSSGKVGTSEALAAMQVPADLARAAIRVSLGHTTTERDIDALLSVWAEITHSMPQAVAV